jgi:hypothetical protein
MAKRALLVGINRYKVPGADLRGCVNDVRNMQGLLTRVYGFKPDDVTTLLDHAATTRAMRTGISQLIASGRKGDVLLFHYSGHGSNVPDADGDEADERDEIVCPTDLDWKNPLGDDWLRKTFNKLRAGVNLTVIMDCCHSGSITRQLRPPDAPRVERFLPCPWDLVATESGRRLRGKPTRALRRGKRPSRTNVTDVPIGELLITGCRDTQTSADAFIGGSYNGALTWSLARAITESNGTLTYRQLHERSIKRLSQEGYSQVPQLEGRAAKFDRPFLSPEP